MGIRFDGSALHSDAVPVEAFAPGGPVRSGVQESRAWKIVGDGPLMGRAKTPRGVVYGGRRYIDLMNATAKRVTAPDGKVRDFLWVRGVRSGYRTVYNDDGRPSTKEYYSDTLLFELLPGRAPRFIERTLESEPEAGILREDARSCKGLLLFCRHLTVTCEGA